ncbi:hydrophobin 2 [Lentinula aciculospora]|uniref:Hydrophobin n=1 Tax=Lentinula aciculospora TaxID=153920 RepID=A0A9W9ALD5_9AGAR|nr:hydrophobin 2 [Lentinula aciculospora]
MQFKFAFVTAAIATLAAATPTPRDEPASSCSTGPVQCCDSVQSANSSGGIAAILGLLGIVLQDLNVNVGLTCSPITVIGTSSSCSAQAVCCEDNSHGGLISIGCLPVTL